MIRKAFLIPDLKTAGDDDEKTFEINGAIVGTLMALGVDFHTTANLGFDVETPFGWDHFPPGSYMLVNDQWGVVRAEPTMVDHLRPGDWLAGEATNPDQEQGIWGGLFQLRAYPADFSTAYCLTPDLSTVIPSGVRYGHIYAPKHAAMWRVLIKDRPHP